MLAALFLSAHSAIAQYSGPVYTGGQASFGGKNYPYGLGTNGYGGGGPGACTCSGGITATFTWNGGVNSTPAPDGVIVEQTSSAYWQGENVPTQPQGACNDGLNDKEGDVGQWIFAPFLYLEIGLSGGTHYSSQTPSFDGNITLNCSPSAKVNMTAASEAEVGYSASIYPVYIQLAGVTTVNGQYEILPGQLCKATLQLPGEFKCSSSDWSITGTIYSSWNETNLKSIPPYLVTPLNFTYPSPYVSTCTSPTWYWDDTETPGSTFQIVSCTADLKAPDGTSFTGTFSTIVSEVVPSSSMSATIGSSKILANVYQGSSDYYLFLHGSNPNGGYVLVYTVTQSPAFSPAGNADIAQIGSAKYITIPSPSPPDEYGLDGTFPYLYGGQGVADGSQTIMTDAPGIPCKPYSAVSVTDTFKDYLMFRAPGDSLGISNWVPLRWLPWNWNAAATEASGGWGIPVTITGSAFAGSSTTSNAYPNWTSNMPVSILY